MNLNLNVQELHLPFKVSFKHASAERNVGDSVWAEVSQDQWHGIGESCPRSYVTGETTQGALEWIHSKKQSIEQLTDLESLKSFAQSNRKEINKNPAAWCAVELAMLDLYSRRESKSIEAFLNLPAMNNDFSYSAVVTDGSMDTLMKIAQIYKSKGFERFKLKISGDLEKDVAFLETLSKFLEDSFSRPARIRVDANNLWKENPKQAWSFFEKLRPIVEAVEEPFAPRQAELCAKLSCDFDLPIILDESFTRVEDFELYQDLKANWVPNIRVSKMGGLLRSLEIAEGVKKRNWTSVVGAQVGETSVLTRAAMTVARELGDSLWAHEGAFGTMLLEQDAVTPVVMFGAKGCLHSQDIALTEHGWGLEKV